MQPTTRMEQVPRNLLSYRLIGPSTAPHISALSETFNRVLLRSRAVAEPHLISDGALPCQHRRCYFFTAEPRILTFVQSCETMFS